MTPTETYNPGRDTNDVMAPADDVPGREWDDAMRDSDWNDSPQPSRGPEIGSREWIEKERPDAIGDMSYQQWVEAGSPDQRLPYVDGPEILARDHAPEPAKIDAALKAADRPASERWAARMNARAEEVRVGYTDHYPVRGSAAATSPTFAPDERVAGQRDAAISAARQFGGLSNDPLMQGIPQPVPTVPSIEPPVR